MNYRIKSFILNIFSNYRLCVTLVLQQWWLIIGENECSHYQVKPVFTNKSVTCRALWLRLSKLCRDTGTATFITFTFLNLYLFFTITISIYGLMSQLSEGFGLKDIGLLVNALCNICLLFVICSFHITFSFIRNMKSIFIKNSLQFFHLWRSSLRIAACAHQFPKETAHGRAELDEFRCSNGN